MLVSDAVAQFQLKIVEIESFIQDAFALNIDGSYHFGKSFRSFVVESSLVKLFIAWEEFLEECFTCYSMAQPSLSGMAYVRYTIPTDIVHAKSMAVGTQKFVEWGNPSIVITLCKLYLQNGEPFRSVISSINQDLLDLRTIRNAAAHLSSTTKRAFEGVATRLLGLSGAGMTVSDLLLSPHPESTTNETVLMVYTKILHAAITAIAR